MAKKIQFDIEAREGLKKVLMHWPMLLKLLLDPKEEM